MNWMGAIIAASLKATQKTTTTLWVAELRVNLLLRVTRQYQIELLLKSFMRR